MEISIHALLAESDPIDVLAVSAIPISIHALLAESDEVEKLVPLPSLISIHALLAESDYNIPPDSVLIIDISIHALLAESDFSCDANARGNRDFYPRSPCGERQQLLS